MATFVQETETAWNTPGPRTTGSFSALNGDMLVACSVYQYTYANTGMAITNNGLALDWTTQVVTNSVLGRPYITIWTTVLIEDRAGLTVTFTPSGTDITLVPMGANILTFRDTGDIGDVEQGTQSLAIPSLSIQTVADASAIVVVIGDYQNVDGASRVWLTGAGALTELTYFHGIYTVYLGYHANAGVSATRTVGLSAPGGQIYSEAAIEIVTFTPELLAEQTELIKLTSAE
jgi:hypothetical protein